MAAKFRVVIFGKPGCDKCKVLQKRAAELLAGGGWEDFEVVYRDVETSEGLIEFCRAECINPQRIPALLVERRREDGGYEAIPSQAPGAADPVGGFSRLYSHLGLQTDYSETGRGIITPRMITAVLEQARQSAA